MSDINYILSNNFATNMVDALNFDDVYLTLSQCFEIEQNDIDNKITEAISK